MSRRALKLLWKALRIAVAAGVFGVSLLMASLWLEHNTPLELPRPSGPFAVGRVSTAWADASRLGRFAAAPVQPQEPVVWIWYPAQRSARARRVEYIPASWQRAIAAHAGILSTQFLRRNPAKVRAHSLEAADIAQDSATYPVVVFRPGVGALTLEYTTLIEDLASHGFLVIGADRPLGNGTAARPISPVVHETDDDDSGNAPVSADELNSLLRAQIGTWTADTRFLLDLIPSLNAADPPRQVHRQDRSRFRRNRGPFLRWRHGGAGLSRRQPLPRRNCHGRNVVRQRRARRNRQAVPLPPQRPP